MCVCECRDPGLLGDIFGQARVPEQASGQRMDEVPMAEKCFDVDGEFLASHRFARAGSVLVY
ncbi:MAG: hypothetical protein AB1486_27995 [Planctomycetota bacterium]